MYIYIHSAGGYMGITMLDLICMRSKTTVRSGFEPLSFDYLGIFGACKDTPHSIKKEQRCHDVFLGVS